MVRGEQRGRALGFPTANLSPDLEGFIPADGVYAGWLTVDGETLPAAVSVGNNPTFAGVPERQVEAHVLDRDLDLYGKRSRCRSCQRIRGMEKFDGVDALVEQIDRDVARPAESSASVPRRPLRRLKRCQRPAPCRCGRDAPWRCSASALSR